MGAPILIILLLVLIVLLGPLIFSELLLILLLLSLILSVRDRRWRRRCVLGIHAIAAQKGAKNKSARGC